MPENLEVKAKLDSLVSALEIAKSLPVSANDILHQTDTYFRTFNGRLKLREELSRAELIFYDRDENDLQRLSRYFIHPVLRPDSLKQELSEALGVIGVVKKKRHLFYCGTTRIHIDEVDGLGAYFELETSLSNDLEAAAATNRSLILQFGIRKENMILHSYIDLLLAGSSLGKV